MTVRPDGRSTIGTSTAAAVGTAATDSRRSSSPYTENAGGVRFRRSLSAATSRTIRRERHEAYRIDRCSTRVRLDGVGPQLPQRDEGDRRGATQGQARLGLEDDRSGRLPRLEIAVRLRRIGELVALARFDLHFAALHHLEQIV